MDRNFLLAIGLSMLVVMFWSSTRPPSEQTLLAQPGPEAATEAPEGGTGALRSPATAQFDEGRPRTASAAPSPPEYGGGPDFETFVLTRFTTCRCSRSDDNHDGCDDGNRLQKKQSVFRHRTTQVASRRNDSW